MARHFRHPDVNAHEPVCQETESDEPASHPNSAYIDVFCNCHHYTEPKILMNGTEVAWPAGWSQEQVDAWCKGHNLLPPISEKVAVGKPVPQAGAQNDPDLINPVPTAVSGVLPDPSNPILTDEARTG
jgi:hypothetical protein